jgi:hypothetical protein
MIATAYNFNVQGASTDNVIDPPTLEHIQTPPQHRLSYTNDDNLYHDCNLEPERKKGRHKKRWHTPGVTKPRHIITIEYREIPVSTGRRIRPGGYMDDLCRYRYIRQDGRNMASLESAEPRNDRITYTPEEVRDTFTGIVAVMSHSCPA